jgi:Co/Zn/Cd efflux system component
MSDCCTNSACEVEKLHERQRSTLLWVLWINATLFVIEGTAGLLASSTALLADALDMFGDALIYGFSLYVLFLSSSVHVLHEAAKEKRAAALSPEPVLVSLERVEDR